MLDWSTWLKLKTIPPVFKIKFPRLTCIIDCFEIFIESPSSLLARAQCYSNYKKHCTIKGIPSYIFQHFFEIAKSTFKAKEKNLSKCWGGRASDNFIVRESGFCSSKYHMPGDHILADRGFTLHDDFAAGSGSELIIPAFTRGKTQLPAKEVENTRKIASVRIHIERVIGHLKHKFQILQRIIPYRPVKGLKDEAYNNDLANCDKIITVCSALINMSTSIVLKPL